MAKLNANIHRLIQAETRKLPVATSFLHDLNVAIEKLEQGNGRTPSKSYKPSSMTCIRNMYFQVIGEPTDPRKSPYTLIGMGESGTDRHERLQNAVSKMKDFNMECEFLDVEQYILDNNIAGLEVRAKTGFETKLYNKDLNMSFLCDGVIKYKGNYYILEIKTETFRKWDGRTNVATEHIPQGTCYSINLRVDGVIFLYENRDSCDKKAYELTITEAMKLKVLGMIESCDSYVAKLLVPPFPYDIPKKTCTYCNYKTACGRAGK
jgi:CRISPR/Cas system-associated exonuclease Cas4 (RecB family)